MSFTLSKMTTTVVLFGVLLVMAIPFVTHAQSSFANCLAVQETATTADDGACDIWDTATSTGLTNTTITSLSSALYNILVIIIPVAVAVGIFFFAYAWVRGVFRNRR